MTGSWPNPYAGVLRSRQGHKTVIALRIRPKLDQEARKDNDGAQAQVAPRDNAAPFHE